MSEVMLRGTGKVGFERMGDPARGEDERSMKVDWVEAAQLAVSVHGVVVWRTPDGQTHVDYNPPLEIDEVEHSALDVDAQEAPMRCEHCQDGKSPAFQKLGRCPRCGRGAIKQ